MGTTELNSERTRFIGFVVAGVVAGLIYPLAGVVVSAAFAIMAKDPTLRVVMAVMAVAWLLFALTFTNFLGSGSGSTSGG